MALTFNEIHRRAYARQMKKPYEDCVECLFIRTPCVLCEEADQFVDRVIILPDEEIFDSSDSSLVKSYDSSLVKSYDLALEKTLSAAGNRAITQIRDGSV